MGTVPACSAVRRIRREGAAPPLILKIFSDLGKLHANCDAKFRDRNFLLTPEARYSILPLERKWSR